MPYIELKRIIEIFLQLAKIEALSGSEGPVRDFIRTFLYELNVNSSEDDSTSVSGGNSGNLICKVNGGGDTVLLAHMDTARSTKDLVALIHDDRITSDGTTVLGVDNRLGIATLLYALEHINTRGLRHDPFTLAFTICEETTLAGSRNLRLPDEIRFGYVFDSALRTGKFVAQSYGAQSFTAVTHGRASHSGIAPERGIHAIRVAARAIAAIDQGRVHETTTINVGRIEGGQATNVVPDSCTVLGEVRSLEKAIVDKHIDTISRQFDHFAREEGATVSFRSEWEFEPYRHDPDSAVYQRLSRAISATGLTPTPSVSAGGSDANSLNALGIPTINIGIGAQNPHGNDEVVYFDDMMNNVRIALNLINTSKT
jgi:tripeptide aminopeptidase